MSKRILHTNVFNAVKFIGGEWKSVFPALKLFFDGPTINQEVTKEIQFYSERVNILPPIPLFFLSLLLFFSFSSL